MCDPKRLGRLRNRSLDLFIPFIAALAAAASASAQQDFAGVQTIAQSTLLQNTTALPDCARDLQNRALSESTGVVSCNGGPGATNATIFVEGSSTAPVPGGSLAAIGTRARIELDTNSPSPGPGNHPVLDATALARFVDFLALGDPRPSSMVIDFQVDGTLDAQSPSSSAQVWIGVYAQSGHYELGNFASSVPFSEGTTSVQTERLGANPPVTNTYNGTNAPDYDLSNTGPGMFRLTLGPSFFANPDNTHVRLDFNLFSWARISAFWQFFGSLVRADSAFEHTMRMTDVRAYDAEGVDVTASAFQGFESVPEPGSTCALGAGAAFMAMAARRRRFRCAAARSSSNRS